MSPEAEKERVRRWNEWWMKIEKSLRERTLHPDRYNTPIYLPYHPPENYLAGGGKSQNKNFDDTISTI